MSYNEAEVYSTKNNSWKRVECVPYSLSNGSDFGVLKNDKFSYMECPDYNKDGKFSNEDMRVTLHELGGCLCQLVIYYTYDFDQLLNPDSKWRKCRRSIMSQVDLWVMKKESWVKLVSIHQAEPVWCGVLIDPMFYSKDGRRILLQIDHAWFGWYDLESKTVETASGLANEPFDAGFFAGSLVSLEEEMHSSNKKETLPRKHKKKNDLDKYLSVGFKLKL